jgi:hypothetical protein
VPEEGLVVKPIPVGEYLLIIEGQGQRYFHQAISLEEGSGPIEVHVPLRHLRGRLTLNHSPLVATLFFGGQNGATKIQLVSRQDGTFEGYLPKAGRWLVDVLGEASFNRSLYADVAAGDADEMTVAIDLADTRIRGIVVDQDGNARSATVTAIPLGADNILPHATEAGEDGTFEFRGLPNGLVSLSAEAGKGLSSPVVMSEIHDSGDAAGIRLVVGRSRNLIVRLVSSADGSPVVGGFLLATPLQGPTPAPWGLQATADLNGQVRLELPPATDSVRLTFGCSLCATGMANLAIPDTGDATVQVDRLGGTLQIVPREAISTEPASSMDVAVFHNDSVASGILLLRQGGTSTPTAHSPFVMPRMAAGSYKACLVTASALVTAMGTPPIAGCDEGLLTVGGTLTLTIPPE